MRMNMNGKTKLVALAALFAVEAVIAAESAFSPVEYRETGETSFEVSVWGRTYRYENSVFPVSIKTAGRESCCQPVS